MNTEPRIRCAFTASEARHILSLIAYNERNGEHTAPREQYWDRSDRIKSKLATPTSDAPIAEQAAAGSGRLMELLTELDQWWRFDNAQQHTHSWHDKQDFLERWRAKAAEGAAIGGKRQNVVFSDGVNVD
jgi:hypothetical protein